MSTKSIKSNIDSVLRKCGKLAALKRYITTCLQRWRQKHFNYKNTQLQLFQSFQLPESIQRAQHYLHYHQKHKYNYQSDSKHEATEQLINAEYHRDFITISTEQKAIKKSRTPDDRDADFTHNSYLINICRYKGGQQIQIIAKLLYSIFPIIKVRSILHCSSIIANPSQAIHTNSDTQNMVYSDINFSELRENHPDIDAEIRGILLTRAQIGSTISEIRDEYYSLTGIKFPLQDRITDFLLTIPNVLVYCNESGTRIFNILPTPQTKHLFELIINQKQNHRNNNKRNDRRQAIYSDNHDHKSDISQAESLTKCDSEALQSEYQNVDLNIDANNAHYEHQNTNKSLQNDNNTDDIQQLNCCFVNRNLYYHDNCHYLYNRLRSASGDCCNPDVNFQINPTKDTILNQKNNIMKLQKISPAYATNLKHLNNIFQKQKIQQRTESEHLNDLINGRVPACGDNGKQFDQFTTPQLAMNEPASGHINQTSGSISDFEAHLLDFLLLGDDFFLYMARMELKCKFKRGQAVLQSGLCVSGQTIRDAIKRINQLNDWKGCIIVNIGSVDIMQYHKLIQIEYDFRKLIDKMLDKNITPILTTLAPLGNYMHYQEIPSILNRFNEFIINEGKKRNLIVIDIWRCLVNENHQIIYDCYQSEPRNVTGAPEPYLFWNRIGRQRILRLIESKLEY